MTERAPLEKVNPGHRAQKRALQVIGLSMLAVGGLLAVIGFISFASSFGSPEPGVPSGFWLLFVGVPMAGIGFALVKFGFLGEIGRYGAGELAPVARRTRLSGGRGRGDRRMSLVRTAERGGVELL